MKKKTYDLELLTRQTISERGLKPEFSKTALQQLDKIVQPAQPNKEVQDLRSLLWCSIDNDDSYDLDQLTSIQEDPSGKIILWIAIADVDALVQKDSPIDLDAQINTTSIYTPIKVYPMLPEKLSTNLTSLNENEDRIAIAIKIHLDQNGKIENSAISQALVRNRAKLTYNSVASWLEGKADVSDKVKQIAGLEESIYKQYTIAQMLQKNRHLVGALTLERSESNAAQRLIENFMIVANRVMADQFKILKIPSLRRVVRIPKRWDRIVEIAASFGEMLPKKPDSLALEHFLIKRKAASPATFSDLSLTVIKLLGRGEYIVEYPDQKPVGHFGLALSEYTHSTAPNRRYPDLISQRQLKAYLKSEGAPYSLEELERLAIHCTEQEDAAMKLERQIKKIAAALQLSSSISSIYKGIITGAGEKGTWVHIFFPSIEGKVIKNFKKLDVGDKVDVKLISVDVPKGHINFSAI